MKTTALAPWFGSNRMCAHRVGDLLNGCAWVGVPFAGGMSELAHINARSIVVNDKHKHVINLAMVVKSVSEKLAKELAAIPFHPDCLTAAQSFCIGIEGNNSVDVATLPGDLAFEWARDYFIASWMGRSAKAGTVDEFNGKLSTRWTSSGGDSNTRYRSAIESLEEWQKIMQRCNFSTLDFREFIGNCKDQQGHGIYCDAPFPDAKDKYKHSFTERDWRDQAAALARFAYTRLVVRFYDHPLIRELYPESDGWKWTCFDGRKQSNEAAPEVLITKNV